MATFALTDCTIWLNDVELSPISNAYELSMDAAVLDVSTFGDSWRQVLMGNRMATWSATGWWDTANNQGQRQWDSFESPPAQPVLTVSDAGDEGDVAYLSEPEAVTVSRSGQYGEAAGMMIGGGTRGRVYRGIISLGMQSITGSTNGTGVQFAGGVAAGEVVAMAVHVTADDGTSVDVILESDDNAGFTSATTRATAAVTGTTYTFLETVAGAVTDDYWRVRTASLVGTSFTIGAAIGIATA